jgi:hypothetical protein
MKIHKIKVLSEIRVLGCLVHAFCVFISFNAMDIRESSGILSGLGAMLVSTP